MREDLKQVVVRRYSERILEASNCCSGKSSCSTNDIKPSEGEFVQGNCCKESSCSIDETSDELSVKLGEVGEQSFGCGNPVGLSLAKDGDIVVDLGSGAGLDCIRIASKVSPSGKVVGVDLSDEMIAKATQNAGKMGLDNIITFVKGDIEDIPLPDNYATLVISNCVVALAPDKQKVFNEAFRILRPGGRFVIADVVSAQTIPQEKRDDMELFCSCISGASQVDEYFEIMKNAGFADIKEISRQGYGSLDTEARSIAMYSITATGYK